ncbi:Inner membrane protein YhaH [Pseudoruegeria aquimaris]|uniref:Inner membrane protein YhaH n=1 Tax=Pseudoruegeria aquimaris TaxID=393663 RepID=A0A1Y5SQY4_9RHOB|nr:DUF805 domain-containing protein [Pseudoruegeria aquimaris]SLN46401.1 Inner membrane protein YhaH [Pseudoruegeria aquimaris]
MTFTQSIQTCFRKYVTFSGRASRSEYWWFFLFGLLGSAAAGILDGALFGTPVVETTVTDTSVSGSVENDGPIASLFSLVILLPSLAVGWRRMHDTGRSGLYLLYPLIVWIGILAFLGATLMLGGATGGLGLSGLAAAIGGLSVLILIPAFIILLIAPLLVLWWLTRPSQPGTNAYGPHPLEEK